MIFEQRGSHCVRLAGFEPKEERLALLFRDLQFDYCGCVFLEGATERNPFLLLENRSAEAAIGLHLERQLPARSLAFVSREQTEIAAGLDQFTRSRVLNLHGCNAESQDRIGDLILEAIRAIVVQVRRI